MIATSSTGPPVDRVPRPAYLTKLKALSSRRGLDVLDEDAPARARALYGSRVHAELFRPALRGVRDLRSFPVGLLGVGRAFRHVAVSHFPRPRGHAAPPPLVGTGLPAV